jgi:anti-sigma factor RsiW
MNVTRDVVKDLLTVYLAGEASTDTRQLVEEYLRSDPELARDVEAVRAGHPGLPAAPALAPSAEKRALDATRQLLKTRTATLVIAVLFTLLPFSFVFEGSRITFVLFRDAPVIALAWWATAGVMWASHIWIRRRLRVSGL